MIEGYSPIVQAFLGTLFTWGMTAAGAAIVYISTGEQRKLLDGSLGFSAGVMLAASYWSLLEPALETADKMEMYAGISYVPVTIGFLLGGAFILGSDHFIHVFHLENILTANERRSIELHKKTDSDYNKGPDPRRLLLLVIAITVHNLPEGLAVGVGFASVGSDPSYFNKARNLAIGMGLQNFPEGLAVSVPLYASGHSRHSAFFYGQLSGVVEPIAGVLGSVALQATQHLLPYALAFAAGAMIYVVVADIIPEAHSHGNNRLVVWTAMFGFALMMVLDVALG